MAVINVPTLHQDISRVIDLPPRQPDIRQYVDAAGADYRKSGYVSIVNIFASPPSAPKRQRDYDLCRGLPDAADDNLLGQIHKYHLAASGHSGAEQDGRAYTIKYRSGWRYFGPIADDDIDVVNQRNEEMVRACRALAGNWEVAFTRGYHSADFDENLRRWEREMALPVGTLQDWKHGRLYLVPHLDLPTPGLIQQLAEQDDLRSLILLTARHELGYLALKVRAWQESIQTNPQTHLACLTNYDLGLLSARVRGYRYWAVGPAQGGELQGRRRDGPREQIEDSGTLSSLYWHLYRWYEALYALAIEGPKCADCGTLLIRLDAAGHRAGRPSGRCEACNMVYRRQQNRVNSAKHRARTVGKGGKMGKNVSKNK